MSPRPRRISDANLLHAAIHVVGERGAAHTRLSDVALVTGLAPATLIQRFGSLDGLLAAIAAAFLNDVREVFDRPDATSMTGLASSMVILAAKNHLPFLLARPESAAAYSLEVRKQIAFSLVRAIEEGELVHCDVAVLARRIQIGFYGLMTAALLEGAPVDENGIAVLLSGVLGDLV